MNEGSVAPKKQTWFIAFGGLVCWVLLSGLFCFSLFQKGFPRNANPDLPMLRLLFGAVAVCSLAASIAYFNLRTAGKLGEAGGALMGPQQFQTQSLVALGLAELCTIFGLLLFLCGDTLSHYSPFAAGTLLVDFAFILPKGVRYWAAWEAAQRPQAPSPFD